MISLSYINGESASLIVGDPFIKFEQTMDTMIQEVSDKISVYNNNYMSVMTESEIMGEESNANLVALEAEGNNLFKKIGETIMKLCEETIKFISGIIDSIKNIGFKRKSDVEKLDSLIKKNPELKDKVICSFENGALNVSDARSITELQKTFDEILKLSQQENVDPKSLRGKWEAAKKKAKEIDKSTVVKVAGATTTVITAIVAVKSFRANINAANERNIKAKQAIKENKEKLASVYEVLEKNGKIHDDMSRIQVLQMITKEMTGNYSYNSQDSMKKVDKLDRGIRSFLSKFEDTDTTKAFHYDMKETLKETRNKTGKATADLRNEEMLKQMARNKANNINTIKTQTNKSKFDQAVRNAESVKDTAKSLAQSKGKETK